MELEAIPYRGDADYPCNDDSMFSYMFETFSFPNEKGKDLHGNYALTKSDRRIFHGGDCFPDNPDVSPRSEQFQNDIIMISSSVKDLNYDLPKKEKPAASSERVDGGEVFQWSNQSKFGAADEEPGYDAATATGTPKKTTIQLNNPGSL